MFKSIPSLKATILFFGVLVLSVSRVFADDPPSWLKQASQAKLAAYEKDVPAVALLDEQQTSFNNGKLVTTENFAVKLLTREGRGYAMARAFYLASSGKVRDISAWIIRPDGSTKSYDKKAVIDIIADRDDVYNEGSVKLIDATGDVDVGYIFGYQIVSEEAPLFYQDTWGFQGPIPTLVSRYSLSLPAGWKASSITFNSPEVAPSISGSSYTWELRDLARIPDEPMSPSSVNIAKRIVVNYAPDNGENSANHVFTSWTDVSRWASALYDPQVVVDDNIAAKARDLTANAQTEIEKIRAIGSYVQNLQYIAIDIGVGHGNGYIPRSSALVLSRGYGDCKDKANLMRALLKALKIEAYPIAIFSGDPTFVHEQWVSPRQFNHCIIAVKVADSTKAATIIEDEKLGRLLIFDATDPHTTVGDLPEYLQGSLAVIIAGDKGGLRRMPVTPPNTDVLERNVEVDLSETGGIKGNIHERARGQASTFFRREYRSTSAVDYRKAIEGWLTYGATGAKLENISAKEGTDTSTFDLDVSFSAASYGQLMQNRLLVFKPVIVARRNGVYLTEVKRTNPVEIESSAMNETVTFNLPKGFIVDEMPAAVSLETTFGSYNTKYEVKGDKLLFSRKLTMNRGVIPVEKYSTVRDFFVKIREAEQSPVVLIRK
ncbi:MAG: DUF3857 and transglutaminase domain-containing protein [Acidobacteriota bacterium]